MTHFTSLYFHGRWWDTFSWKAISFKNLFNTIPIPYDKNYDDAVRYFKENFSNMGNLILIWNSAWVLPIISICHNYTDQIQKVILLNPATSMMNMNTINKSIEVKIYSWTNDYGRNIYMEWDDQNDNIKIFSIPWNHNFTWRNDMINEIIRQELE